MSAKSVQTICSVLSVGVAHSFAVADFKVKKSRQ
jgi:hypothetical protein